MVGSAVDEITTYNTNRPPFERKTYLVYICCYAHMLLMAISLMKFNTDLTERGCSLEVATCMSNSRMHMQCVWGSYVLRRVLIMIYVVIF